MFDKILTSMSLKDSFLLAGRGGVSLKRVVGSNNENKIIVKNCVTTLGRGEWSEWNDVFNFWYNTGFPTLTVRIIKFLIPITKKALVGV